MYGDTAGLFRTNDEIIISRAMSVKIFGNDNPVGKTLLMDKADTYRVAGVFEEPPVNSSFTFQWVVPFSSLLAKNPRLAGNWSNFMQCYVELEPTADVSEINRRLLGYYHDLGEKESTTELFLFPVTGMHLYDEFKDGKFTGQGEIRKVRLFAGIAGMILLIACINFMNLATARSQRRMTEVGVKKTFGMKRHSLVMQFMGEAALITFLSLLLSAVLLWITLPFFNNLIQKNLRIDLLHPVHIGALAGIWALCTLLAGSYPAFYLSSFRPVSALKGLNTQAHGVVWMRRGLVVFQFAAAYILICCTAVVYLQIRHVTGRPLGYNREQVIRLPAGEKLRNSYAALHQELQNTGAVVSAGMADQEMMYVGSNGWGYQWPGKDPNTETLLWQVFASEGLMSTLEMNLQDGRDFRTGVDAVSEGVIINRCLADMMGEEGRVGGHLDRGGWQQPKEIIGIVDNMVFNDIFSTTPNPMLISKALAGNDYGSARYLFIRLKPQAGIQAALGKIETVVKQFNAEIDFAPVFMDSEFGQLVRSEKLTGTLASLFSVLAVVISCLGIFGLSAFAAEQRTRETGIRKVLGASVWSIVVLLGRSFMALIAAALVIAIPVAWYASSQWLYDYAYRIPLAWWIFAATCVPVVVIALVTVSAQSVKAAMADPVKSIKGE
jgi:ABC-type antimicrobial peptide transport system permease subunit